MKTLTLWQKLLLICRLTLTMIAVAYIVSTVQRVSELASDLASKGGA